MAGGLCAFGMLVADVRHTYLVTDPTSTGRFDSARINEVFDRMETRRSPSSRRRGSRATKSSLHGPRTPNTRTRSTKLMIPLPPGDIGADHAAHIAATFHDEHERLYTYCIRDMPVDLNAWRVIATGRLPGLTLDQAAPRSHGPGDVLKETRKVFFSESTAMSRRQSSTVRP